MKKETFSRSSILAGVTAAALILASAAPAFAQGNSQGNKGNSNRGGNSAAQMNVQGVANSNGRNTIDRDFGRDRAAERMRDQDRAHTRAGRRAEARTAELNREATRIARLRADERAGLTIDREDRINNHGANKTGFCPPGQAKKAGKGSRFNC